MFPVFLLPVAAASGPDLVFQSITAVHHRDRGEVALQVVVENIGDAQASETSLDVLTARDWEACDAMLWDSSLNTGLAPGETVSLEIAVPTKQLMGSPVHLFLDMGDRLPESNERNNEGVVYLMSEISLQPERTADWTWWQHSSCMQEAARERNNAEIGLSRKVLYSRLPLL